MKADGWMFQLHDVVRLAACSQLNSTVFGYVHAREYYEDPSGTGEWYQVRFINPDGRLGDQEKLHASEIVKHDPPSGFGFGARP